MNAPAFLATLLFTAACAPAQNISGDWHGSVEVHDDAPLRLALHISNSNTATVDSADEGVAALPVDSIQINNATIRFQIKSIAGVYRGTIAPDDSRIMGTWSQDGGVWPLTWERGDDPANISQPITAAEAKQNGQTYAQWFYEGKLAELWLKLSPVVRQAFGSEAQLNAFREQTVNRLGIEKHVLSEGVAPSGILRVYRRTAEFQKGDGAEIQFAFAPGGVVVAFSIDATAAPGSH